MEHSFEKNCDNILSTIIELNGNGDELVIYLSAKSKGFKLDADGLKNGLAALESEGFINKGELTSKGRAFYYTDSFLKRRERWDIENKMRHWGYRFRWFGWLLSIIAIIISIISLRHK